VAIPAPTIFFDLGNEVGMAAATITFHHRRPVIGDVNSFGNPAGVKGEAISHTFHSLPEQVVSQVIVGEVAVDALDKLMAGMEPGLIFRLEDVTTAAELRALGFGKEAWGSKSRKYPQTHYDNRGNQYIGEEFFLGRAHDTSRDLVLEVAPGAGRIMH
jgi:hypothetical protein